MSRERVSHSMSVPTQAMQILESPAFSKEKLASLVFLGYGGAPASAGGLGREIRGVGGALRGADQTSPLFRAARESESGVWTSWIRRTLQRLR